MFGSGGSGPGLGATAEQGSDAEEEGDGAQQAASDHQGELHPAVTLFICRRAASSRGGG